MLLYWLDKLINGRYLITENASLYTYFFNNDINFSRYNIVDYQYTIFAFDYLTSKEYKYFDNFIDIQTNFQQNPEKISNFFKQNLKTVKLVDFVNLLSIKKQTQKKWNILKLNNYYLSWYQVEFEKLEAFRSLLKKYHIKWFFFVDLNMYNPHIFINESISNFIDLILLALWSDDKRIRQYIESIGIDVGNIVVNLLNDKDFKKMSKDIIKQNIIWKYFQLIISQKKQTVGKIHLNFYMITKEIDGLHINYYPVLNQWEIILKQNETFEAKSYVELNKIQQTLNPIAYHFWNIYKPYYDVGDRMDILSDEQVLYLKQFIKC